MKTISDDDLTLLYYGEHEDPALPSIVAASETLSARFDALSAELKLADYYEPPERGEDYGSEVWRKISPRLNSGHSQEAARAKATWLSRLGHRLWNRIRQPRFSLAGAFSLALVAVLAFMLGRNGQQELTPPSLENGTGPAAILAGIDSSALLSHSVSGHLEQVNLVLTQFVNVSNSAEGSGAELATDLLVANRLYRQAATSGGDRKLALFLAELEPLLIELAHEAQSASPLTRDRMKQEVSDGLLFRVRVMNNQLRRTKEQSEISI